MNERPLPDDLAHWPDDPNELLGVSFGVTPRDLRRAYHRLIRVYKPEQFPEQFRRIREAYEHLLRIAEWYAPHVEAAEAPPTEEAELLPAPKEESPDDDVPKWIAEAPRPVEDVGEEATVPPWTRRPKEELDELWQTVLAGRHADAYRRLVELTQQHTSRIELYQRLYWLLTLAPELDARRGPADWLVQGMLATDLAGPLRELYREETADDPTEALSERYDRLLDAPMSAGQLADLIEERFQAAVRLRRWDVLHADLPKLRPRFGLGEELLWLRLLFALADGLAWEADAEGESLLDACREEIAIHEHLASNMSHLFDRFDLLVEASSEWFELRERGRIPATMLRLIRASWSRPFAEVRQTLMTVLESMAGSSYQWLALLDEMRRIASATLSLFGELLDQFEAIREETATGPRERQRIYGLVLSFIPHLNAANYEMERARLLQFCLREDLTPEEIAEVANGFTGAWQEAGAVWAQALTADWPLRHLCRACRLFWA